MPPRDPNRGKDKFVRHEHSYNILPKSPSRRLVRTPHEEDDAPYHAASPRQLFRHPHIEAITGEQYDVYHRLPTGASTSVSVSLSAVSRSLDPNLLILSSRTHGFESMMDHLIRQSIMLALVRSLILPGPARHQFKVVARMMYVRSMIDAFKMHLF